MGKLTKLAGKAVFMAKKHAPEGLLISGLISIGYGAYRLCKGTLNASERVSEGKEKLKSIEDYYICQKTDKNSQYTEENYRSDISKTKKEMIVGVARDYAPGVGLMTLGTGCILYSHHVMSKRQLALIAAYNTIDGTYRVLKDKILQKYGKEGLEELEKAEIPVEGTVKTVDEDGNETNVRHLTDVSDIKGVLYDRFFDDKNPFWVNDCHSNVSFLINTQDYLNHEKGKWGKMDLNFAYYKTGFKRNNTYGMVTGWEEDNYIDFGLRDADGVLTKEALDYIHGGDPYAPLRVRFNVDGVIYDEKKKKENENG